MRQAGGWGAAAGSSLLGLLLLVLAIPRLASAFYLLPGEEALQLVKQGSRPSDAGLLRAIDAQAAALDIMPRGEVHMDTAYLAQALAESTSADEERAELVGLARRHLGAALALAPGNPRGWMMLAGVRVSNGEEVAAARALQVSFAADPHVLLLAPFRWPLAGLLGSRLTREAREDASLEFLSFFRSFPEVAVRMALRRDRLSELSVLTYERGSDRDRLAAILARMRYQGAGT